MADVSRTGGGQNVAYPAYDRTKVTPGIVHIGLGNFSRAHLSCYLDDLFAAGGECCWGILGAGVREADARMRDALLAQDCMSTLIELDPSGTRARRLGSVVGFIEVDPDNAALIAAMSRPEIKIVSLTVTEGGYFVDPATGTFDPRHPDIVADARKPDRPRTAFGAIVAALQRRRDHGTVPFTIMSCDNLPGNGDVAKAAVCGLAQLSDPHLASWIEANVAFPNSMVDRITPATGKRERDLARTFGLDDAVPVTCEPFRQWVLEDKFCAGRPRLEDVGVVFTEHVHDFETMKIRILNGGHAIIAYAGGLLDIELVHEAMSDPLIAGFLAKLEKEEILPIVPPVPNTDLGDYLALIIGRFSNPEVGDTIRRLCLDGSSRQPKFIIPSIRDNLKRGIIPRGLILESALWCRYCAGATDSGSEIEPNDPNWDRLQTVARRARSDPAAWLAMDDIYGEVGRDRRVAEVFASFLNDLDSRGARAVLQDFLDSK
ncbi:mannitol 2-dehydrogenase [Hyaloraphidium curvatum]|nr:mannitol 2-dehydrogenase [Hyaloraphidium curvatum]